MDFNKLVSVGLGEDYSLTAIIALTTRPNPSSVSVSAKTMMAILIMVGYTPF